VNLNCYTKSFGNGTKSVNNESYSKRPNLFLGIFVEFSKDFSYFWANFRVSAFLEMTWKTWNFFYPSGPHLPASLLR
jgi:hypothetical protein